eukprot:303912_1
MSTYFDNHEKAIKRSIIRSDRIMLHKLTSQTLFCPHCYQPFLINDQMIQKQLVSPFAPLFDYISAIIFLAVPIAWIPLLIISLIGTILQYLNNWFTEGDRINEDYSNIDYDQNYFAEFMSYKQQ